MQDEYKYRGVYHYTDLNALINIDGENDLTLWATNIKYLNDTRELKEGVDIVNHIMQSNISYKANQFDKIYTTSFSKNKDSLQMWAMYAANGAGCALQIDPLYIQQAYNMCESCVYGRSDDNPIEGTLHAMKNNFFIITDT